jgi:pyridoxamine 5'-phosphate oxidase
MLNPQKSLRRSDLSSDPISQFRFWLQDAEDAAVTMPIAMTLATANAQGRVAARVVLLRGIDECGFLFYTNYESDKSLDLKSNPSAALVFHWQTLSRQIRIEGAVELLTDAESDEYFASRPRGNQLAAHASPQSRIVEDRQDLEDRFTEIEQKFEKMDVVRPANWGGYRVVPEIVEFWQEGEHRMHDRFRYRLENGGWAIERLGA